MNLPGRSLGLDVGDVRVGVARSDPMGIVASPHSVFERGSDEEDAAAVEALLNETEAVRIVIGMPLNQYGEVGDQAKKVEAFVENLRQRLEIEIVTIDERFTTAIADQALRAASVRGKKRKKLIDKIAAQQILQTYLDRQSRTQGSSAKAHRSPFSKGGP